MSTTIAKRRSQDSYFDLVHTLPLRPIRSEVEFDRAMAILLKLVKSTPAEEMDAGEQDYIEALTMLVQQFERKQRQSMLPKLAPIDRLKFLMGEQGMTVNDLGRLLGSQPNASLILHGRRAMSKTHIIKLARHFDVSPALFLE